MDTCLSSKDDKVGVTEKRIAFSRVPPWWKQLSTIEFIPFRFRVIKICAWESFVVDIFVRSGQSNHHSDVIMGAVASQITDFTIDQLFIQAQIKENIKAPRHWPLCGEFTDDRWITRTNGQ